MRLVEIGRLMAPEIAAAGGELHVGLYTRQGGVNDVAAKLRETAANYRRSPFLRELWGWPPDMYAHLDRAADVLDSLGFESQPLPADARERAPKMHRKTQLFATREGLQRLGHHPNSQAILAASLRAMVEVLRDPEYRVLEQQETMLEPLVQMVQEWTPEEQDRAILYFTAGSMNRDSRGAVLDGEVLYCIRGPYALWSLLDLMMLGGSTTWVASQAELEVLLPPPGDFQRWIGRRLRTAL